MKSAKTTKKILFVHPILYDTTEYIFYDGFQKLREDLLRDFPNMASFLLKELFISKPIREGGIKITVNDFKSSTSCKFLQANISTPSKILVGDINPLEVIDVLSDAKTAENPYTHVGFSVFVSAYSRFVACAKAVKRFDPNIVTLAGNVGALFPETEKYVDYVVRGDGVPFLRKILNEKVNTPYKPDVISGNSQFEIYGINSRPPLAQIVTKFGCVHNCDFCITSILFDRKATKPFATPQEVHKKIIEYRHKTKKDFMILLCEPQAIIQKKWWYELFDLFEEETGDFPIGLLSSQASLSDFDFDRISNSALRISGVNIGLESFTTCYNKNRKYQETKALIRKLRDYGIGTVGSFIIGFDYHDHKSVWEDIQKLIDLDMFQIGLHNLKPLPGTPLWHEYEKNGRLLKVPNDFYYIQGFQAFTHPHFKSGFEDMLPLMYDIFEYIEKERGPYFLYLIDLMRNIPNQKKCYQDNIKLYTDLLNLVFPSWKENLDPTQEQINRYLDTIGGYKEPPQYLRKLRDNHIAKEEERKDVIYAMRRF